MPSRSATSTNPLLRLLRTELVPRVLPLALGFDRAVAYGFRTVSQLNIGYRHSPAVQEGRLRCAEDPWLATGSPMRASPGWARKPGSVRHWPRPGFHLLLCGPPSDWHTGQLTTLRHRHSDTLAVHHLTRTATPGALQDRNGQAFARLGIDGTAQYLIRPDGHIGYRAGGDDLAGLQRHLARWLPNTTSRPA